MNDNPTQTADDDDALLKGVLSMLTRGQPPDAPRRKRKAEMKMRRSRAAKKTKKKQRR